MPLKLIAPREGKTSFYAVRGTHLGVYVDRSTKTPDKATAGRFLRHWREEIERGRLAKPGEPTFLDAVTAYIADNGEDRFLEPLTEKFGALLLREVTQEMIDAAALELYPRGTPGTRNRHVHTPVSAVLKHAGIDWQIRRPKGWRGKARTEWLKPEQAFRVLEAATNEDAEFGLFLLLLCYTGMRLGEALALTVDDLDLNEAFLTVHETKNGDPRGVHLPPMIVAGLASHPRGLDRRTKDDKPAKLFRFVKCGRLYTLLGRAKKAAGNDVAFTSFHTFRHTWATWMRRYGGLDTRGLLGTQTWKDAASVRRYEHVVASEESVRADLLPVPQSGRIRGK